MPHDARSRTPRYPMTRAASGAVLAEATLIVGEERLASRLAMLHTVLALGDVGDDTAVAAIGRRITVTDERGASATYALVLPGDGDPTLGWVSIDSPLGAAVAGRRAGEPALVVAPGGSWRLTIAAVESPPYPHRDDDR